MEKTPKHPSRVLRNVGKIVTCTAGSVVPFWFANCLKRRPIPKKIREQNRRIAPGTLEDNDIDAHATAVSNPVTGEQSRNEILAVLLCATRCCDIHVHAYDRSGRRCSLDKGTNRIALKNRRQRRLVC